MCCVVKLPWNWFVSIRTLRGSTWCRKTRRRCWRPVRQWSSVSSVISLVDGRPAALGCTALGGYPQPSLQCSRAFNCSSTTASCPRHRPPACRRRRRRCYGQAAGQDCALCRWPAGDGRSTIGRGRAMTERWSSASPRCLVTPPSSAPPSLTSTVSLWSLYSYICIYLIITIMTIITISWTHKRAHTFSSLSSIERAGSSSRQAIELVQEIARRIADITEDSRETA